MSPNHETPSPEAHDDLLEIYMQQIRTIKPVDAAQEVELAKYVEAGLYAGKRLLAGEPQNAVFTQDLQEVVRDGQRAKERLVGANLQVVASIAKHHTGKGLDILDLIQEGNLGLIRAVEKFDYTKGFRLYTYASRWIAQAMTRAIDNQARTIRTSVYYAAKLKQLAKVEKDLHTELCREPEVEEIATEMSISPSKAMELLQVRRGPLSLEYHFGQGEGRLGAEIACDDDALQSLDAITRKLAASAVLAAMETLSPEEQQVLYAHEGLRGTQMTFQEIAKGMGKEKTTDSLRKTRARAMAKLYHPSRRHILAAAMAAD